MSNWISDCKCWNCSKELATDGEFRWCMNENCIVHLLKYHVDGGITSELADEGAIE